MSCSHYSVTISTGEKAHLVRVARLSKIRISEAAYASCPPNPGPLAPTSTGGQFSTSFVLFLPLPVPYPPAPHISRAGKQIEKRRALGRKPVSHPFLTFLLKVISSCNTLAPAARRLVDLLVSSTSNFRRGLPRRCIFGCI